LIDDLWKSARGGERAFDPATISGIPIEARRYLEHAIAPGTTLANAVRLKMHGEIKLKEWLPFRADEVICWDRGMIWRATVKMHGIPIYGSDRYLDGQGAMQWRLLGIVPVAKASGPDITRSAAGRMNIESTWLPSAFCGDSVSWTTSKESHLHARFKAHGELAEIDYVTGGTGALRSVNMPRWGSPEGAEFRLANFGGFVEESAAFGGYTVPVRMRIGWHFGTDRFEPEGEFFRVTIDDAVYR
jgi:hypothetical protein